MKWGMVGFEEEEQMRPQFKGLKIRSPVHGRPDVYYSLFDRKKKQCVSSTVVFGFILVVLATIASIFALKVVMAHDPKFSIAGFQIGDIVASILNAVQIQLFNDLYGDFAVRLNDYENHRTDTEYENALISKTFMFQFVNSFSSLFYIGFVKPFMTSSDACFGGVRTALLTHYPLPTHYLFTTYSLHTHYSPLTTHSLPTQAV